MFISKQVALELEREHLHYNFDFDEDTQTYRCRFCGSRVGWYTEGFGFQFSSAVEGEERIGQCYDCWVKEHPNNNED